MGSVHCLLTTLGDVKELRWAAIAARLAMNLSASDIFEFMLLPRLPFRTCSAEDGE